MMIIITDYVRFYFRKIRQDIIKAGKGIGSKRTVTVACNQSVSIFSFGNIFIKTQVVCYI